MEYLIRSDADVPTRCESCGSDKVEPQVNSFGGYFGDLGSGSTRPRGAGSFKKTK